jgi:DNA-binding transcriptional LysR family regulator
MWTAVELRELRIFLVLAEELHFGRAAQRLRISQPGVSEAIRSLEARLGGRLFDRTSRRVRLTSAGEDFRHNLVPALATLDRALSQASDNAVGVTGPLRIGFTATTHGPQLSRFVGQFRSRHPDCQVTLHEVDTTDPYACLRRGDVDMLVGWLAVDEPDLTAGPAISLHDRALVVSRSHGLASRPSVLMDDLPGEQVALLPQTFPPALYDAILPPRTPSGRPIARTQPVQSIGEVVTHVADGRIVHITMTGVSVFSRDDVVLIPVQDLAPTPLGLIWCSARYSAKIRALADTAQALGPLRVTHPPASTGTPGRTRGPNQQAKVAKRGTRAVTRPDHA